MNRFLELVIAFLLLVSPISILEIYNHFTGGDYLRPWVLTKDEMSRLKVKELLVQNYEQQIAKEESLNNRLAYIEQDMEKSDLAKRERKLFKK